MCEKRYEQMLSERAIKITALRTLILKVMSGSNVAMSLTDLENALETVDKSTISRTLNLFHEKHLIHSIDDGTGSVKYSVCSDDCDCILEDQHIHFHCNQCNKTFCFRKTSIPVITLPIGFQVENVNFVLKGLCASCRKMQSYC